MAHSTVTYVEPNLMVGYSKDKNGNDTSWHINDDFVRAPRLEDYCIALNIEVEVSSRDNKTSQEQANKDVIILQWNNNGKDNVNFLAGTKVGGYDIDNDGVRHARIAGGQPNLTTYYADLYVGDLIDFGTTEMIGIKSVNIEYAKSCVPVITVQFTDVRGISLFQPTELSRINSYDGIKGLNKDNVAQSFFQCFFKMPLPKFTFYVKGYYGNPVAYVMMCDKFDTNFNSESGDFDVTARFIGYSYSFLTDVSFDAIYAAPYSDYEGKRYWEENIKNGRFFLWDKLKTEKKPMPTLFEIQENFRTILEESDKEMLPTTITKEEMTHADEIKSLEEIKVKYQDWYGNLYNELVKKYGKRYVFDFKENNSDADWYRILILTNNDTSQEENLSNEYTQFSDTFKKSNDDLYAAIEEFNRNKNSYKKLDNISKDFTKYTRQLVFNNCYVNRNSRKIEFNGFNREYKGNKTQIVNRLFHANVSGDSDANKEWVNKYGNTIKEYTLSTIYNDGVNQYVYAYFIDVDYRDIKRRINVLNKDASKKPLEKEREIKRKEHNRNMLYKMNWYPSIENFTKIMMAHLETLMMMMYKVSDACSSRTAKELGVSIGSNGNACDVNVNSKTVPPFPRLTREEIGEDGITRVVDAWVGNFSNTKGFEEVEIVNGLFNAVDDLQSKNERSKSPNGGNADEEENAKSIVKHPLTSYDFFLDDDPYGVYSDVDNNPNAFAGKVAIRMFNIIGLNYLKKEYPSNFSNESDFIKQLGTIEAENFYENHRLSSKLIKLLGTKNDSGTITPKAILDCVTKGVGVGDDTLPWISENNSDNLFNNKMDLIKYITSYSTNTKTRIYPIQNLDFKKLETTLAYFNKGSNSVELNNNDIIVDWIDGNANADALISDSTNDSCYGSMYIADNYKRIADMLASSNSSPNNSYKEMYNLILDNSVFKKDKYKDLILSNGVFRPKKGIKFKTYYKYTFDKNPEHLFYGKEKYTFDKSKMSSYLSEVENNSISSWFFTECRGFNKTDNGYAITNERSLYQQRDELQKANTDAWKYANAIDRQMAFFLMGLESINYTELVKSLNTTKTFVYMPKLAVLQIGAALSSLDDITKNVTKNILTEKIPLPKTFESVINYLNNISNTTRIAYVKYFKKWVDENNANIISTLFNETSNHASETHVGNNVRILYKEDSLFSTNLADNLMKCICLTKGNTYHFKRNGYPTVETSVATKYLDSFLSKLRELYNNNTAEEEKQSSIPTLTKSPTKITEDMKIELYRYLKLLYDKWIPAYKKETWLFETFFDEKEESKIKDSENSGHLFHFIDSFYNKIGDKLLINPSKLCEKLDAALENNDTNIMMLGFLADIFSQNKCMLLCLQNFLDLGNADNMNTMFKPIPYNDMELPKKHPDFVVVYPYEPSKNLNVDNSEFTNDSFMLDDEFDTPMSIRSRSDGGTYYKIPAFGVCYGSQYQNFFKKVSVGMSNPIATQQAILAKHSILKESTNDKSKSTVAQDLYDIYTTQSFTCNVEMMGCAWIQPLMYFVLTNVPMFRGSYLILKVTHKITPGNMVTEFTGTRMANVSNRFVEDIFTDEESEASVEEYQIERMHNLADIDNECDYKVYPLYVSDETNLTANQLESGRLIMKSLINQHGFSDNESGIRAVAGICGNIVQESSFDHTACCIDNNGYLAGGLFGWNDKYYNLTNFFEKKTENYGQDGPNSTRQRKFSDVDKAKAELGKEENNVNAQLEFMINTIGKVRPKISKEKLESCKSPEDAAEMFRESYEKGSEIEKREHYARQLYEYYIKTEKKDTSSPSNELTLAFFNAVNRTVQNTPSIGVELSYDINDKYSFVKYYKNNFKNKLDSDILLRISQKNGKKDKLSKVFDVILNSSYYNYVQTLFWCYNTDTSNILSIYVSLNKNPKIESRAIYLIDEKNPNIGNFKEANTINKDFLMSIKKKYGSLPNKEVPQLLDNNVFNGIEIKNCDNMIRDEIINNGIKINEGGMVSNWNAEKAGEWLVCATNGKTSQHICAFAVQQAVIAGGIPFERISKYKDSCNGYRVALNLEGTKHWEFIASGTTLTSQISGLNPQVGDIIGMTKGTNYNEPGHVCMYCGSKYGWVSDYQQGNAPYPYGKEKGVGKYWVVRYKGGSPNTTQKPSRCIYGKCLNNCSA